VISKCDLVLHFGDETQPYTWVFSVFTSRPIPLIIIIIIITTTTTTTTTITIEIY